MAILCRVLMYICMDARRIYIGQVEELGNDWTDFYKLAQSVLVGLEII